MNFSEEKMISLLKNLKEEHHVVGIKAEFEAEGTRFDEAVRLKQLTNAAGLDLTIKIGGCEALKDIYDAKIIGANTIVAPMIESAYAMQKFIQASKIAFSDEERKNIKLFINIETINGFKNIDEILSSSYANDLDGIVFGRTDMTGSLGLDSNDVNSEIILDYAQKLAQKTNFYDKEFIIGGGICTKSIPFLAQISNLKYFETRKVIFDTCTLKSKNIEEGILKAIDFELMWVKNKQEIYNKLSKEDAKRIEILKKRQSSLLINQY